MLNFKKGTEIETITPDIAKEYLRCNLKNRLVKPRNVESIARQIKRGEYKLTHQGIAFNRNGELVDGQHRLLAVIMANQPVEMMVTRGLDNDVVLAIDRGVNRSVRDTLTIDSRMRDNSTPAALLNSTIISALNQLVECCYKRINTNSTDTIRLFESFSTATSDIFNEVVSKSKFGKRAIYIAAGIAALECGVNIVDISKFYNIFFKYDVSGCSDYNVQAVLNWRKQIDNARMRRISIDRKKLFLGTQNAIYHFVNNTNVSKTTVPSEPRYNVRDKVLTALNEC